MNPADKSDDYIIYLLHFTKSPNNDCQETLDSTPLSTAYMSQWIG